MERSRRRLAMIISIMAAVALLRSLPASAVDACPMPLATLLGQIADNAPVAFADDDASHGDYVLPAQQEVDDFAADLALGLTGNWSDIDLDTAGVGLQRCEVSLADGMADVLYEPQALDPVTSTGLPVIVIRRSRPQVPIVLSVPHAATEANVVEQGLDAFLQSMAVGVLVIAPQHRCHLLALAPDAYQGSTSECDGVYRQSDAAHTQQSLFHAVHRAAWMVWPQSVSLQIHGMSAAGISVSGGLTTPIVGFPNYSATAFHDRYAAQLESLGYVPEDLTTCSSYEGPRGDRVRQHLCGTKNAQRAGLNDAGRLEQFIHLEQVKPIRQDPLSATAMAVAIDALSSQLWSNGFEATSN